MYRSCIRGYLPSYPDVGLFQDHVRKGKGVIIAVGQPEKIEKA
jgi:hypothetical protein